MFSSDDDTYFYIGRADSVITSAGYRVGPEEVETTIRQHHAVADVAVVGIADEVKGTVVKAIVVLKPTMRKNADLMALSREIAELVRVRLAKYMIPARIEFVSELPRSVDGRLVRSALHR